MRQNHAVLGAFLSPRPHEGGGQGGQSEGEKAEEPLSSQGQPPPSRGRRRRGECRARQSPRVREGERVVDIQAGPDEAGADLLRRVDGQGRPGRPVGRRVGQEQFRPRALRAESRRRDLDLPRGPGELLRAVRDRGQQARQEADQGERRHQPDGGILLLHAQELERDPRPAQGGQRLPGHRGGARRALDPRGPTHLQGRKTGSWGNCRTLSRSSTKFPPMSSH